MRRLLALVVVLSLAGCVSDGGGPPASSDAPEPGGTLRLAWVSIYGTPLAWDPLAPSGVPLELLRCCLLRRLYSYPGKPGDEGGTVAQPDLAAAMPEVSADGLTWTIEMQSDLRYAPPYEDREIVVADVVRALERLGRAGVWTSYFSVIRGFDDYVAGRAEEIAGIETPDRHTLVLRLSDPAGDLPDRLSIAPLAPFPAGGRPGSEPGDPPLAASGPYMVGDVRSLAPSSPGATLPVHGDVERSVITLVRSPSWAPDTDDLRAAYPDRIRVDVIVAPGDITLREDLRLELWGQRHLDVMLEPYPRTRKAVAEGRLPGSLEWGGTLFLAYVPLNLAVPPFDDIHVRRAVNLAFDRIAFLEGTEKGYGSSPITWHLVPDALEGFRLPEGWVPTWAEGVADVGSLAMARREMARSRYDADGDGRCDGRGCTVLAVGHPGTQDGGKPIARTLRRLGIALDVQHVASWEEHLVAAGAPANRYGLIFNVGWIADYANASTYFVPLLYGPSISERWNAAHALLGATPEDLARWGYEARSVPSIDDRIERCVALFGEAQTDCWTELDRYTMEDIVPWVPLTEVEYPIWLSPRVTAYSYDQSLDEPSYDRIALAPEGGDAS